MDARARALLKAHERDLPPLGAYPLTVRSFAAGELLAAAGEPLTQLSFLVEGFATVFSVMENGRVAVLTEYRGVQTIGEVELLMGHPTLTGCVQASTPGTMLCLPLIGWETRIFSDAPLLRFLGREIACKLERSSRLTAQDRLYPLASRLAAYLLYKGEGVHKAINLTRLSEMAGVSYRHLLRTMRTFADKGWICREGDGYRILQPEALARLAGEIRYD